MGSTDSKPWFDFEIAIMQGDIATVKSKLRQGENVRNSITRPLIIAINEESIDNDIRIEMVKLLIKAGANVNCTDVDGNTPLIHATLNGYTEIVRLLINAGANVNKRNKSGNSPLTLINKVKMPNIYKLLKENA